VFLYTRETPAGYPNYYLSDQTLERGQRVTDANPQQKDFLWTAGTKLVDYTNTHGQKLQAALHLPANYQPGKKYPTIVYIYEHGCPVRSRTESIGCQSRANRFGSRMLEVPVKWAFSRKE